jgi:hypothetical protein
MNQALGAHMINTGKRKKKRDKLKKKREKSKEQVSDTEDNSKATVFYFCFQ